MIAAGFLMEDISAPMTKAKVYGLHKSFGVVILALVSLRIVARLALKAPPPVSSGAKHDLAMQRAATLAHAGLYFFMFCMPLSGWAYSNAAGYAVSVFGWFTVPDIVDKSQELRKFAHQAHYFGALGLCGLILLHFSAAIYHQFILRDGLLARMLPSCKKCKRG